MSRARLVQQILTQLCCAGLDFPDRRGVYMRVVGHDRISEMTEAELRGLLAEAETIYRERRT